MALSTVEMVALRNQIVQVLRETGEPMRIPEIEVGLRVRDTWGPDTFDVRDAVHELVRLGRVDLLPGRIVALKE